MTLKGVIVPATDAGPADGAVSAALQRVANRPILCHVLEELHQADVVEAALVVPAGQRAAMQAGVELEGPVGIAVEYLPYGSNGSLRQALAQAMEWTGDAPCVVHLANGLLAQPLAPLVEALHRDNGPDMVALVHQPATGSSSIELGMRRLLRLAETSTSEGSTGLAGACLFGAGALRDAHSACRCQNGELDLTAIAQQLVDQGGRVSVERVHGWRSNTGEMGDLLELNRIVLDALALEPPSTNGTDNRIEGRVEVHPSACVSASVIVGPAIVGAGALVLDSYIGPYTAIGADVRIEGAEIERSIILPRASITHIGGRLEGSVVGHGARIFRDFSLPRALRLNVGDGGEVALC